MPKIKTNRTASKKFRVTGKGKIKRSQAFMSHNTAKKSPKRVRNLRKMTYVDPVDVPAVKAMLPNSF
jgi:large subunit ribosomal protein L35